MCQTEDQELSFLHRVPPAYPPDAALLCLEGKVRAAAVAGADGHVRDIEITASTPRAIFNLPASAAIGQWSFTPACRNGKPVDRHFTTEVEFVLADRSLCPRSELLDEAEWSMLTDMLIDQSVIGLAARDGSLDPASLDTLIGPGGQYTGALGRLEQLHRQHMKDQAEFLLAAGDRLDQTGFHELLDPQRLEGDNDLSDSRQTIQAMREFLAWADEQSLEIARRFHRQAGIPGLNPELRRLIEARDPSNRPPLPEGSVDYESLPDQAVDAMERLVDTLDDNQGAWRVANGAIRFDDPAVERRYQAGLARLERLEQNLQMARIAARLE